MFLLAVKNTCKYMLVTIPVTLGTALCISVILQQITKGQKIFRLSFLYPIIMPIASIVLVIQFFFKNNGFLNLILNFFYLPEKDWLHTSSAFWIICILYFWKFVGYYIFIYSSRLQMIPKEYYEYASLHGAGKWQSFYYITCPISVSYTHLVISSKSSASSPAHLIRFIVATFGNTGLVAR